MSVIVYFVDLLGKRLFILTSHSCLLDLGWVYYGSYNKFQNIIELNCTSILSSLIDKFADTRNSVWIKTYL